MTDDAGWLDDETIAAVLPHTPASGASKLADDVCLAFPDGCLPPLCEVYCYPWPAGPDGDHQAAAGQGNGDGRSRTPASRSIPWRSSSCVRRRFGNACWTLPATVAALVVLSPLLLLIGLGIKLTSRGPVFYSQRRHGWGGRVFTIYKFRSMVADADAKKRELDHLNHQDGPAFKINGDPRTTKLGRFLRRTSLDELPQLWNVLRGDMSLVGPHRCPAGNRRPAWDGSGGAST